MMEASDAESDGEFITAKGAKTPLWSSTAYSSVLGKSMRAMMSSSGRRTGRQQAARSDEVAELFVDAVARKDKEKMLDALAKDPGVLRQIDVDGRLPLHLVCALRPNYRYVDMMHMMINTYPEAVRCVDKNEQSPLHTLCCNPCVTVQALGVFASSLAELTLVQDSHGDLPLHCLCRNACCDVGTAKKLGSDTAAYTTINEEGQTPLHCLVMVDTPLNTDALRHLIGTSPNAALMRDLMGRTVLHWICERHELDLRIMQNLFDAAVDAASLPDMNGDLPLHILCQNEEITRDSLHLVLQTYPAGVHILAKNALSPLHFLCSNERCSVDLLTDFFSFDKANSSCATVDAFGATPLHLLCMNEAITTDLLRTLLLMSSEDSFTQDVHGRSPLHYLCMNQRVSPELLWLFFDRGHDLVRLVDKDDRTPLHYLCGNTKVTPRVLEILFDSWPSAALIADREFKLPVQYLVDNPASSTEVTALLICGPASYRHRYEFLSVNGQCVCFTQGADAVYIQTNVAMDSNTATKVLVNFYSSQSSVDHEQKLILRLKTAAEIRDDHVNFSPTVYESFEDAKRRLTLRSVDVAPEDHNGDDCNRDAIVTLDYALVMEAPSYTLEGLRAEKLCDTETVRAITTEVANCLLFWHCDARMVHGNITLQSIGQFEDRGLCLFNLLSSRELYEQRSIGSHAIALSSCPPEAAMTFVAKEEFVTTQASDMWQFGCLVYQLLSGKSILERLAPWIESIGHEQGLHLICSLSDGVLEPLIAETAPEFRLLLQRTLVVNPSYRWSIDRLMHLEDEDTSLPSFETSEAPSHDLVGKTLAQKTEEALADGTANARSAKHTQEQLEFMKKEQSLLRHTLLSTKSQLRDIDQARTSLQMKVEALQAQMTSEVQQKQEAQLEAQLLARNHQAMTLQLHTTVHMLLNLVPLARKVYGAAADDFLSSALAQATGGSPPPNPANIHRKTGPVQLLKTQLQHSVLAHGCVHKWANSSTSNALAATEAALSDENAENESNSTDDDNEDKPCTQAEDADTSAAAVA